MTRSLFPSLDRIERELFGAGDVASAADSELVDPARGPVSFAAAPPAHLLEMMERRVAAERTYPPTPIAVGQIRRMTEVRQADGQRRRLGRSCAVLLRHAAGGRRWAGWVVAQESDWASERDLILQEEDGVLAPEAAVVQAWNPVEVELRGNEAILGKLAPERLDAVAKLAAYVATEQEWVAPRPGRIGAWDLDASTTVVTGTPLAGPEDPRAAYQALYRTLGVELGAVGRAAGVSNQETGWLDRLRAMFARPAATIALAGLAAVQAGLLLSHARLGPEPDVVFRDVTLAAPDDACRSRIRLRFRADTPYSDVIVTLRRVDARLIAGPSETGDIWILPPLNQEPGEVAALLRRDQLLERSEVVQPERRECRR